MEGAEFGPDDGTGLGRDAGVGTASADADLGSLLVPARLSIWSWVLGYTALLSSLSVLRYRLWLATGWDLGFYRQGLWLLLHRGLLAVSTYTGYPVLAHSGSYVLILLAPLYAIGGVGLLLLAQAFALGLGYYFIRQIGRNLKVADGTAHLVGLVYLIYPTIVGANLFDFHPDVFGVPLLFGLVSAVLDRRWSLYTALLLAAVLVKDTMPLLLIGLVPVLLWRREALWSLVTGAVGLAGLFVDFLVVVPHLAHGVVPQWMAAYSTFGPTPSRGLSHLMTHPQAFFEWVHVLRPWEYVIWLLGPFVGFAYTGRLRLLNAWWIPGLLIVELNVLSLASLRTSPFSQESLFAVPFFIAAVLAGSVGVPTVGRRRAMLWMAVPVLLVLVFVWRQHLTNWRALPARATVLAAAVAAVPPDVPVAAQNFLLPHLSDRAEVWQLGSLKVNTLPTGTDVVLYPATTTGVTPRALISDVEHSVAVPGQARVVFSKGGVTVVRLLHPLGPLKAGTQGRVR